MSAKPTILVIDANPFEAESVHRSLLQSQYDTIVVHNPGDALAHLNRSVDLVVTSLGPDEPGGRELWDRWRNCRPGLPYFVITRADSAPSAPSAIRTGEVEYFARPIDVAVFLARIGERIAAERRKKPVSDLPDEGCSHPAARTAAARPVVKIPPGITMAELEREAIEQALQRHDGNRTHAANALGISVRTLQRKLKAWQGTMRPDVKSSPEPGFPKKPWEANDSPARKLAHNPRLAAV
jgi:DNA-binding NtrC family response regulator